MFQEDCEVSILTVEISSSFLKNNDVSLFWWEISVFIWKHAGTCFTSNECFEIGEKIFLKKSQV